MLSSNRKPESDYRRCVFILLSMMLFAFVSFSTHASTAWDEQSKSLEVNKCSVHSYQSSMSLYQTMFKGKLSNDEYAAFNTSIRQEMRSNCECLIDAISAEYSYLQYRNQPDLITNMARDLSQPGAACAPNMTRVVNQMRNSMGIER